MTPPDLPTPTRPVTVVGGRYRLDEVIGRGGMATVHRAHDTVLDRPVAVKVLLPHLAADEAFLERFRNEARTAAALSHPNIVAVHDWGEDDDGPYLVMELVDGISLRDVLALRGRLAPGEALALLGPAAAGLAAAHRSGSVHRDVKPENILLSDDGSVKVTDFGLALAGAEPVAGSRGRVLVGSPHYLPPEAARGRAVDARGDVYALGVVLFELLVGHPPFQAATPAETALLHVNNRVPAPSGTLPELPRALDRVVATATAPDPEDRFPDAAAFAFALDEATPGGPLAVDLRDGDRDTVILPLDATTTLVADGARRPRQRRVWRRLRRVVVAVALLAAVGVAGYLAWDQVVAPVTTIPVVLEQPLERAVADLEARGFDVNVDDGPVHSLEVAEGLVVDQDPMGSARRGSTITVSVSAGPRPVAVPEVVGIPQADAEALLTAAGLDVRVVDAFSEEVPAGDVVAVAPPVAAETFEGETVTLTVSQGRQPVQVPRLVGRQAAAALALLRDRELLGEIVEERFDDEVAENVVIEQQPTPGAQRFLGDTVSIVVSLGPEPFGMPVVRDLQEAEAVRLLEARGLVVTVVYVDTVFGWRAGRVDEQIPAPDRPVRAGDDVTLYVWR